MLHAKLESWKSKGQAFHFKGHELFYIREGNGPHLIILHGYPYNSYDWALVWEELTSRFTVILPDMLGMGFSDKPHDHHYSYEEHVAFYCALLKKLNVSEAHLLAHDLGNSVVQEMIAVESENKLPFIIKSIAFLNGGLFMDVYKPRLIQKVLSKSPKPVGRLLSKLMSRSSVSKATCEVFGAATQPSDELMEIFWQVLNYKKGKSIAYLTGRLIFEKEKYQERWISGMIKTKIPMCFINGPADPNSGLHMANRYKELIPNPKVYLLNDNIGHWPQIEDPKGVLSAFFCFQADLKAIAL